MLHRSGESGLPCPVADLRRQTLSFLLRSLMLTVGFHTCPLFYWGVIIPSPVCWHCLLWKNGAFSPMSYVYLFKQPYILYHLLCYCGENLYWFPHVKSIFDNYQDPVLNPIWSWCTQLSMCSWIPHDNLHWDILHLFPTRILASGIFLGLFFWLMPSVPLFISFT